MIGLAELLPLCRFPIFLLLSVFHQYFSMEYRDKTLDIFYKSNGEKD